MTVPAQRPASTGRGLRRKAHAGDVIDEEIMGIESTHLLAGGGGDMAGFVEAGTRPVIAVNHMRACIDTVRANWPWVRGLVEDVARLDMHAMPRSPVLVASPICTEGSPSGRRSTASQRTDPWTKTRMTAWCLVRYAEVHRPEVVCGENVLDFATRWELFAGWLHVFELMGYTAQIVSVNAAHLSGPGNPAAPQLRDRLLFVLTRRGIDIDLEVRPDVLCPACGPVQGRRLWKRSARRYAGHLVGAYGRARGAYYYVCPKIGCGLACEPVTRPIRPGIDWSRPLTLVGDGRPHRKTRTPYADRTRAGIQAGLGTLQGAPFLAITRKHGGVVGLDGPIPAVTGQGNHHMLVVPGADGTVDGCGVRMLGTAEKAYAQRFTPAHRWVLTRTSADTRIRDIGGLLTGNAVSVNVAHWLAERIGHALAA
ncbi:DNA cytosine methyltransferase [Actinomadura graeca]|uniref:DNA cytosine methyltransferase n=1 Tax=Actinomadura graeca TaxID=2750812 RepID=A0ABX8R6R9_9ACTN|nr:DNA cytosine methyltransferase [Actinomadura graeca]QXJ25959.1 DNA cytosine methyltransferase [Actinomadura graeca]